MAILNNSNAISSGVAVYDINNSLRLRKSASAYLNRTNGTATNQSKGTWSFWVKRGQLGTQQRIFEGRTASSDTGVMSIEFTSGDLLDIGGWNYTWRRTTQVFRDPSAWYHIVIAIDTTQATAANRILVYVNGSQVTSFGTTTNPTQNDTFGLNNNSAALFISNSFYNSGWNVDGYLAEINFVDGQQLTPSSFGETDTTTGSWLPKAYTSTYGTNGFYLKFSDIATTSGSNAGLGKDFSGNGNYWTTNNISVTAGTTYDAMIDSPTLTSATVANYATFNPINGSQVSGFLYGTASSGNLDCTSSANYYIISTIATPTTGKYYFEYTQTSTITSGSLWVGVSINGLDNQTSGYAYASDARKINFNTATSYGATWTQNDVIGCALDLDNQTITFYKNNVSQGTAFTGITQNNYFFGISTGGAWSTKGGSLNCGQRPFAYTPPTGFVRLNTFNLPDSTVKKGSSYMDATTYTGTGATATITNAASFKADFVWIKCRSGIQDNSLFDSVRGTTKYIISNSTAAEVTDATTLTAFNSNGWTMGSFNQINNNASTYVGWQWQAGQGTNTSNTSGSITSTVSVNTTAGFSIVTYTGNGSNGASFGHGLGVAPAMVIFKNRTNGSVVWVVHHQSFSDSAKDYLVLNATDAKAQTATNWFAKTSSIITLTNAYAGTNVSSENFVAYCWAEIAGFSAFGSYTGNGLADGAFVYTGFRPKWIMTKRSSATDSWMILDTARGTYNVMGNNLRAESSAAEQTNYFPYDVLSNGFKLRTNDSNVNLNGSTYIYMAFAENPFKNSLAR